MTALGVDAFVTKPFSNRALMDTVRALLGET
jgi:DNA-binding response OmpR family regulator